jgi:hypothetical protein
MELFLLRDHTTAIVLEQFAVVHGAWHFVFTDADELDVLMIFFEGNFDLVYGRAFHDDEFRLHVVNLLGVNGCN